PELGVDDRLRIVRSSHPAGAERVVNGDRCRPDMGLALPIGPAIRTGRDLPGSKCSQVRLCADLARGAHAGAQRGPVLLGREEILAESPRDARILRGEFDMAAALGPQ